MQIQISTSVLLPLPTATEKQIQQWGLPAVLSLMNELSILEALGQLPPLFALLQTGFTSSFLPLSCIDPLTYEGHLARVFEYANTPLPAEIKVNPLPEIGRRYRRIGLRLVPLPDGTHKLFPLPKSKRSLISFVQTYGQTPIFDRWPELHGAQVSLYPTS